MAVNVDGRTARAVRTRRAVVDAFLALLAEGDPRPTAERIAERAGVSLRSLWTNFADLETLYAAAGQRQLERQAELARRISPRLPLAQRVAALARQRAQVLEFLAPVARAAQLREPFSAQLRANRARQYQIARDELAQLFAAELEAAGPGADELLNALTAASTWPAWSALRDDLGLGVPVARQTMARMLYSLLSQPPTDQ
ncbi:TetR/AcrR family transcriptional regulator [Planosporangium thailandense]|uniref:TetR/AcrR family transcriptional regulator n=1 Tax=Planosporangium thailandense TaxID=765197 RepID=A0ABX0XUP4_9ACTN|nr:TetR/AcrR family transcriptional regulator [Planosporangium thailandense]